MLGAMLCLIAAAASASVPAGITAAPMKAAPASLTAEQIVEKNVAARGGLEAWRGIQTMVWVGRIESPSSPDPLLPFSLQQKRPNRTHFEINTMGQKTVRVFDGTRGWNARPGKNGAALDVRPFTAAEVKFARAAQGIDGPLIDYAAKGTVVTLVGIEKIEGRRNYRLNVRLASGETSDVWIDAQTFLDTRFDRTTYTAQGQPAIISVLYHDYKTVEGLVMPAVLEIGAGSKKVPDKMIIEKIALNPPLDANTFTRPGGMRRRGPTFIDIDTKPGSAPYPIGPSAPPATEATPP
jgi:hypothetical protein